MCGRYTLGKRQEDIADRFQVDEISDTKLVPRFNIAPSQQVPIVIELNGHRVLQLCKWGFIPSWAKDLNKIKPVINARVETVAEKPFFKKALTKRRCLIPADGFFEWKATDSGKIPMRIALKDEDLFAFAGLFEDWVSSDGEVIRGCTIITLPANDFVADIHDRMPAVLEPSQESLWLDPELESKDKILSLLQPYDAQKMIGYPVSKLVNSTRVDTSECIVRT